jgi:hypothetical protein
MEQIIWPPSPHVFDVLIMAMIMVWPSIARWLPSLQDPLSGDLTAPRDHRDGQRITATPGRQGYGPETKMAKSPETSGTGELLQAMGPGPRPESMGPIMLEFPMSSRRHRRRASNHLLRCSASCKRYQQKRGSADREKEILRTLTHRPIGKVEHESMPFPGNADNGPQNRSGLCS